MAARIARTPQHLVPPLRVMLPSPRRRLVQRPLRRPRAPWLAVGRLLLRAAVAPRAGELVQQPHPTSRAGKVLMSLLAATRVTTLTVTRITASASLLPAIPPATLRAAVGEAEALAAVLLVVLVAPGIPALGVAICLGKRFGRR